MNTILTWITGSGGLVLLGMVVTPAIQWVVGWIDGKGAAFIKDELEKLKLQMNNNSVLSQIKADDALIDIIESIVPEVIHDTSATVQNAIKDGHLNTIDWKAIAVAVWAKAEAQVKGGANDYLKNSSFSDGQALAEMIIKRFFKTENVQNRGLTKP